MFNLDPGKLLIIGIVAVILLGPDRLPQVARQVGGAWRSFNEFRHRMETEVRGSIPDLPSTAELAHLARSPTALLHKLSTMGEDGTTAAGAAALADTASGAGAESVNGNGSGSAAAAANTSTEDVPDGTPIEHTPGATVPVSMPGPTDATVFGDPSLN
jgi:sec-independent protein translocase protein TatB